MKNKILSAGLFLLIFCAMSFTADNTDIEKILGSNIENWTVSGTKYNVTKENNVPVLATAKDGYVSITGKEIYNVPCEYNFSFYLQPEKPYGSSINISAGCAELPDKTKQEFNASVSASANANYITYSFSIKPETAKAKSGLLYFQAVSSSDINLSWPEEIRKNIEWMVASAPKINETLHNLRLVITKTYYRVYVDGRFVGQFSIKGGIDGSGTVKLTMYYGAKLVDMKISKASEIDERFFPLELTGFVNRFAVVKGCGLAKGEIENLKEKLKNEQIPFIVPSPQKGNDHIDLSTSWTKFGAIKGYIAANFGTFGGRWVSADKIDSSRFCMYVPYARYKALHIIGTFDGEKYHIPVITAQFYRPNAGHPMNFAGKVPVYWAKSGAEKVYPVKLSNGQKINLFHVVIPIDPGAMDWFSDLDRVGLELTKEVKPYRAYPDPLEYSWHSAGLPSGVHIYAATLEAVKTDIDIQPDAIGHVWTAPLKPSYTISVINKTNTPKNVRLTVSTSDYDGIDRSEQSQTISLSADKKPVIVKIPLNPKRYGLHYLNVKCSSGNETYVCSRNFAYLHPDTRERGNWSEGKGPIFGYWNWSGGHDTPDLKTELIVMAQAGAETNLQTYRTASPEIRKLAQELGYVSHAAFDGGVIYVNSFAYANAKYYDPKNPEATQKWLIEELKKYKVEESPINKPEYILFFPEPGIGPITYGVWPTHYNEPDYQLSESEQKSFQMQLEKFLLGAKAVRNQWPDVKILLPHGDPHYTALFLRFSPEARQFIDGVGLDLPGFERTPEQPVHQVVLNRLYPILQDIKKYKPDPYLVVVEGTCISSADYDTSFEDQANIATRNFLVLIGYGINNHASSNAPFDCANYWGENHYGGGYCSRLPLAMPKLAYVSYATLTRHINRCNFVRYVPTGSTSTYCQEYRHYKTGKLVYVLWTVRGKRPVTIKLDPGQSVEVYDINDNPKILKENNGTATFIIGQAPVYLEGLTKPIELVLGEPDHSDTSPSKISVKLGNLGDGTWKISKVRDSEYENTNKLQIERFPGEMTITQVKTDKKFGGKALSVHLEKQSIDRKVMPYYTTVVPSKPITIPGKASHLGLWVNAASGWGRVVYVLRDAKGEKWISVGTKDDWNSDDIRTASFFCFDGWRYIKFQLPSSAPYDCYRELGTSWWGSYGGDGIVDLPLKLEKIIVERRSSVIYGNTLVPANNADVLMADLYAEYENQFDSTQQAITLSKLRMPVPQGIPNLENPITIMEKEGVLPPVKILKVEDPEHMPDGTRCHIYFGEASNAKSYDVWASIYPNGIGAIKIASGIANSGALIQGLKPDTDFYLFVTYTDNEGKMSKPSQPLKVNLKNKFLYQ
ncbi:MAG TPA: hypothetical protein PK303_02930 [bacterium]|nr:hypothetical protein [bacterium]HOL34528.1 hypothetical protein [bacterium]HPP08060.1 hypothetical protein [bacterium]